MHLICLSAAWDPHTGLRVLGGRCQRWGPQRQDPSLPFPLRAAPCQLAQWTQPDSSPLCFGAPPTTRLSRDHRDRRPGFCPPGACILQERKGSAPLRHPTIGKLGGWEVGETKFTPAPHPNHRTLGAALWCCLLGCKMGDGRPAQILRGITDGGSEAALRAGWSSKMATALRSHPGCQGEAMTCPDLGLGTLVGQQGQEAPQEGQVRSRPPLC